MENILITGVSTGIGYHSTKYFIEQGYFVFGSIRKKEDADRLQKEFGDNFHPLIFDVCDFEAIRKSVVSGFTFFRVSTIWVPSTLETK